MLDALTWFSDETDCVNLAYDLKDAAYYKESIKLCEAIMNARECHLNHGGGLRFLVGICYYKMKQYDKAEQEFERSGYDDEDCRDEAWDYFELIYEEDPERKKVVDTWYPRCLNKIVHGLDLNEDDSVIKKQIFEYYDDEFFGDRGIEIAFYRARDYLYKLPIEEIRKMKESLGGASE